MMDSGAPRRHALDHWLVWAALAVLAAIGLAQVSIFRGEHVNALWIVVASVSIYLIAYRYYSLYIARTVMQLDATRQTPAYRFNDGLDYVPTNRYVLFGHHFAAIAGAGPLVGPVLAAQMGYLPGMLWILAGVVIAGAVQDFMVLFVSMRRDGRSLGDLIRSELGPLPGIIALIGTFLIMIIILAVLALIVVKALAESPWGMFTVAMTVPIAILMGIYMRYIRPGAVGEASIAGFIGLMAAIVFGSNVAASPTWSAVFTFTPVQLCWILIGYGFVASTLPVWLLLAPRDYLSTFLKIGAIAALALGILFVAPDLKMPAVTRFIDGTGPVWSGSLFPFLFITIACGAVSGFHALISSGTTPKLIENERDARFIGFGGMLMESFVAMMALVSASIIDPGIYFVMNSPAAAIGTTAESAAAQVSEWGFTVTPETIHETAADVGETSIISRAGGAPTLAVGMAHIFSNLIGGKAMMAFWYHFAILFEALFILTAVDAGTRAGRFMLQDFLGVFMPAMRKTSSLGRQHRRHRPLRRGVGLLSLPGGHRPARRREHALAALRHRQPDAGGDRADAVHGRPLQDEARALRLRHAGAVGAPRRRHADRRGCRRSSPACRRSASSPMPASSATRWRRARCWRRRRMSTRCGRSSLTTPSTPRWRSSSSRSSSA